MGLRAFIDEYDIGYSESITRTIEQALGASKALAAYYSKEFSSRPACQLELSMAYIAAQHRGDPCERIIIVNPEADTGHILPADLADPERVIQADSTVAPSMIARAIGERVTALCGVIGDVSMPRGLLWHGRPPNTGHYTWRYPELWGIHSALAAAGRSSTELPYGPTVSVVGQPGAGKSALVEMYTYLFGSAFESAYWPCLTSRDNLKAGMGAYDPESLQIFAHQGQNDLTANSTHQQFLGSLAAHLDRQAKPSLWVINGIPPDFDRDALHWLLPPTKKTWNILVSNEDRFDSLFPAVEVGPLTFADARELVAHYRKPADEIESAALDRLITQLGRNARALYTAGLRLQDMQGLLSYDDYTDE